MNSSVSPSASHSRTDEVAGGSYSHTLTTDLVQLIRSSPASELGEPPSAIQSAGVSRVTYCSDPPLIPPNLDELAESESDTHDAIAMLAEQRRMILEKQRAIDNLSVQQQQMEDMLKPETGLLKDEYFDLAYLKQEAARCWADRIVSVNGEAPSPRLFPRSGSPFKKVRDGTTLGSPQKLDSEEFQRRHPIMFRNIQRNKTRRQLFEESMNESAAQRRTVGGTLIANSTTSTIGANNNSSVFPLPASTLGLGLDGSTVHSDLLQVRSRIMGAPPIRNPNVSGASSQQTLLMSKKGSVRKPATTKSTQEPGAPDAQDAPPQSEGESTDPVVDEKKEEKPKTLADLLNEQKKLIEKSRTNDAEVYKPLLECFFKYEEQAQRTLDYLASDAFSVSAPVPVVTDEATA
jgi:hypothetical protein